ncbi:hypothetical protein H4I95_00496 [Botrytis cinerea]
MYQDRFPFPFLFFPTFHFPTRHCKETVPHNAVPTTEPSQQRPSWLKKANECAILSHLTSYYHLLENKSQYLTTPAINQPNHYSYVTQLRIKLSSVSISKARTARHVAGAAASLPYDTQSHTIIIA